MTCKSAKGASARLICADPDLAALDSKLATAFQDAKVAASPDDQKLLVKEQQTWTRERNQKCGLTGKDNAPIRVPLSGKQCVEDAIEARIAELQHRPQAASTSQAPASNGQDVPPSDGTHADSISQAPASNGQDVPPSTSMTCKSAKGTSARLICADPDLAALDSKLAIAFQDAKVAASPDDQKLLVKEQQTWTRERNQKCGLTGKDNAPIRVPLSGKQCVEDAIEARIAELQHRPQAASISQAPASNGQDVPTSDGTHAASISQPAALIGRNVIINPLVLPTASVGPGGAGPNELPTFQELHFSVPTEGIGGIISCSVQSTLQAGDPLTNTPLQGQWIVKIAIDDDASSYRLFENDTWAPVLDDLRNAVHSACASALKTGRLRDAANEPVSELNDVFAAYSPRGLFLAYSIGQNTSWTLQTNLPKARKKVKTNLGIQTWVDPSQLTRNPYFFKGSLVGMVIQFDRMLSQNEAVFTRPGAEIFVSGVPPTLFQTKEMVVLAGRVVGNKGVISPLGSEALLPALDYVGAYKCGSACENF
jgi:uncharacterized protein YecT (DUF1311 family)